MALGTLASARAAFQNNLVHVAQCASIRHLNRVDVELNDISESPFLDENPWADSNRVNYRARKNNKSRFRQHVNPLSRKYQMETPLHDAWPKTVFDHINRPLHLDIGCGKGGFLLELAKERPGKNYLGLEIRPSVAEFAQERVTSQNLEGTLAFVGCNANVDLERLLTRYETSGGGSVDCVTIQFPDPHFKKSHAKRRVVTPQLVETLAMFMPTSSIVFLQSDIQNVLDDMRLQFRKFNEYFRDELDHVDEYMPENYIGIPTEREISVIKNDLPVFRTVFKRTSLKFEKGCSN